MSATDPWADPEMVAWAAHVKDDLIPKVTSSAVAISIAPRSGEVDIKFAVELGVMIMLNKPILVLAQPGQTIPPKLALVADLVVHADTTTSEGQELFTEELKNFIASYP